MQYSVIRVNISALNRQITQPPTCLYLYSKHRFDTSFPIIKLWHTRKLTNTVKTDICGGITISPGGLCLPDTVYCIILILLYSTVLYCTIHWCNILYYTILQCTMLLHTMQYCPMYHYNIICYWMQHSNILFITENWHWIQYIIKPNNEVQYCIVSNSTVISYSTS